MWYEAELAIPAGTPENAPVEVRVRVTYGVIHRVVVEAAPGCHRMAAIRIYHQEHQVYPTNPEEDIALDSVPRDFEDRYLMDSAPYDLVIRGYAPSATYAHSYRVGIGIMPPDSFPEYSGLWARMQRFLAAVGIR